MPKASHQLAEELDILDGKVCSLVYSKIKYLTLSATARLCIIGYGFFCADLLASPALEITI